MISDSNMVIQGTINHMINDMINNINSYVEAGKATSNAEFKGMILWKGKSNVSLVLGTASVLHYIKASKVYFISRCHKFLWSLCHCKAIFCYALVFLSERSFILCKHLHIFWSLLCAIFWDLFTWLKLNIILTVAEDLIFGTGGGASH